MLHLDKVGPSLLSDSSLLACHEKVPIRKRITIFSKISYNSQNYMTSKENIASCHGDSAKIERLF